MKEEVGEDVKIEDGKGRSGRKCGGERMEERG